MSKQHQGEREAAEVNVHRILGAAAGVIAAIVVALAISRALLGALGAGIQDPPRAPRAPPPAPREQPHPRADYQQYRTAEQAKLESYAWVDRHSGIVQIPIERAMSLEAREGPAARAADEKRP